MWYKSQSAETNVSTKQFEAVYVYQKLQPDVIQKEREYKSAVHEKDVIEEHGY